jgi:hypothetical protein
VLSKVLGAVGVVLLIAGVTFGVRPITVSGRNCGSVFQPGKGVTPMQCDARLSTRGSLVVGLGGAGVAAMLTGFAVAAIRDRRTSVAS